MIFLEDILAILSMSEAEQETYLPELAQSVLATDGVFQIETSFARMILLCVAERKCKQAEAAEGEFGLLCSEIAGLSSLLIEASAVYDWIEWHPKVIRENDDGYVDRAKYEVWSVLRRLAREASRFRSLQRAPRPFFELFRDVLP